MDKEIEKKIAEVKLKILDAVYDVDEHQDCSDDCASKGLEKAVKIDVEEILRDFARSLQSSREETIMEVIKVIDERIFDLEEPINRRERLGDPLEQLKWVKSPYRMARIDELKWLPVEIYKKLIKKPDSSSLLQNPDKV